MQHTQITFYSLFFNHAFGASFSEYVHANFPCSVSYGTLSSFENLPPDGLPGTILRIMVQCLHVVLIFMLITIPLSRLNADFMRQQMAPNNKRIKIAGANSYDLRWKHNEPVFL